MNLKSKCAVCGAEHFSYADVLWDELIQAWELQPHEVDYINKQQGLSCKSCGNNLRSMALARSVTDHYSFSGTLDDFISSADAKDLRVLEINEAGGLTPVFSRLPGHTMIQYPEHDITNLVFESDMFDMVVHSDTLEHVSEPITGLSECRRVLKPGGTCFFTVPIIVERMTRMRHGFPPSFHGAIGNQSSDLLVQTEYGADVWTHVIKAGFQSVSIFCFDYPAAMAIVASKSS